MGKKSVLVTVVLVFACVFVFQPSVFAKTIELKFGQPFSPKHTMQTQVFEPWAKEIAEKTNGQVKVTMFPGGALGKAPEHYDLAEFGIADIVYTLQDYTPGRFPMTTVVELPFLVTTAEKTSVAMWKLYEEFPEFAKEYSKIKLLALFCHDPGLFNTIKTPVKSLDDLKGLKFRTASPHVTKALKMFGAVPVTMPITETYQALERGVVDGTVLPWEGNFVFKLAELLKYGTEANWYTMPMMVAMNKAKYEGLPADVKKAIDETTGMVMSQKAGKVYDDMVKVMKGLCMKKGMEPVAFPEAEREKLAEMTLPLRDEFVQEMDAKGLPGKAVLEAALKYVAE